MCHLWAWGLSVVMQREVVFLKGEIFARMDCSHHIDVSHTYFMYSFTSFAFILPKSIIVATLVISCHKGCCIKQCMFLYVLDGLCCITKLSSV